MWSLDRKYKGEYIINNFKKAVHHAAHRVVHVSMLTAKTRLIYHCCFLSLNMSLSRLTKYLK